VGVGEACCLARQLRGWYRGLDTRLRVSSVRGLMWYNVGHVTSKFWGSKTLALVAVGEASCLARQLRGCPPRLLLLCPGASSWLHEPRSVERASEGGRERER